MTSAKEVNQNGILLEQRVRDICIQAGYNAIRQYRAGCRSLYGKGDLIIDVYIYPCKKFPNGLGIEVTEQGTAGSGAHKMPHRVLSIVSAWPIPGIIVIGARKGFDLYGAIDWAEWVIGKNWGDIGDTNKYLGIFTIDGFVKWLGVKEPNLLAMPRVQQMEMLL